MSNQIAEDVRAEYLAVNPIEARKINEEANKNVTEDRKIIIASAIPGVKLQESSRYND